MSQLVNSNSGTEKTPETDFENPTTAPLTTPGNDPVTGQPFPEIPPDVRFLPVGNAGLITYEGVVVRILQLVGGIDHMQITPDLALERISRYVDNVNVTTRQLHGALDEQNGLLVQMAMLGGLKEGQMFTELLPIFTAWKPAGDSTVQ